MRSLRATLLAVLLALTALALVGPASASAASCSNADTKPRAGTERALGKAAVCLINRERKRRGLRALRINRRLSRGALAHSLDMVQERYFEHVSQTGENVVDRLLSSGYLGRVRSWLVGENLAWGTDNLSTPRQTVAAWMNSPPHRKNILNRRFREIGIGVVFHAPNASRSPVAATYTTTFGYRR